MKNLALLRPAFYYSPDTGGSGGGGNPPTGDPPGGNPPPGNPPPGDPPKTFTQEQLDKIIQDRLSRAEETATNKLLEGLGIKSVDDLKKSLADFKKIQDEKLTAQEKLEKDLKEAQDKALAAESEKDKALKALLDLKLSYEVRLAAAGAGFRPESIEDVVLVLDRTKIKEKDGKFDGIKEALDDLAKLKPFWLADKKTPFGTPPRNLKPKDSKEDNQSDRPKLRL